MRTNPIKWRRPIPLSACPDWLRDRLLTVGEDEMIFVSGTIRATRLSETECAIGCTIRKPDAAILRNVGIDLGKKKSGK